MFSFLRGLLGKQKKNPADGSSAPLYFVENIYLPDFEADPGTRYPPFPEGCEIIEPRRLLAGHRTQIARLKQSLGLSEHEFRVIIDPVLVRYAEFVHLLPASQHHHHKGRGGLLRHGLEVAFHAARMSGAVIYDADATPRERRNREKVWRVATALAGLLHDVGKPVCDMKITSDTGLLWNFALHEHGYRLVPWARENKIQRYFVSWREDRTHNRHAFHGPGIARLLIPKQTRAFLTPDNTMEMLDQIDEAIGGYAVQSKIAHVVLKADQASVTLDLKLNGGGDGSQAFMPSVERYLVEGIRRMIKSGRWKINEVGAIVYVFREGLFINWKAASRDVLTRLNDDGIQAIPKEPAVQADMLIHCGVAVPREVTGGAGEPVTTYRYWAIKPVFNDAEGPVPQGELALLKIQEADLFFPMGLPAPMEGIIGNEPEREKIPSKKPSTPTSAAAPDEETDSSIAATELTPEAGKDAGKRKKKGKANAAEENGQGTEADTGNTATPSRLATTEFDALLEHVTHGPHVTGQPVSALPEEKAPPEPAAVSESPIGMDIGADFFGMDIGSTEEGPPLDAYEEDMAALQAQEHPSDEKPVIHLLEPESSRKKKRASRKSSNEDPGRVPSPQTGMAEDKGSPALPDLLSFADEELAPIAPVVHADDACFEVMDMPFAVSEPHPHVAFRANERIATEPEVTLGRQSTGHQALISPARPKPKQRRTRAQEKQHSDARLPASIDDFTPFEVKAPELHLERYVEANKLAGPRPDPTAKPVCVTLERVQAIPPKYLHTVAAVTEAGAVGLSAVPSQEWTPADDESTDELAAEAETIDLDVTFVKGVTPQQCLEQLAEMIRQGYGRWIPGTIHRTKRGYSLGVECLDLINNDCPEVKRRDLERLLRSSRAIKALGLKKEGDQIILGASQEGL
jgi:conjugal transfer pilus assembly protein TraI